MNIQLSKKLEPLARNYGLEDELDHLLATELLTVQSIRLYLDVLETLREKYNEKPALHTARSLANYIRRPNINLDLHHPTYRLSSKHLAYLDEISAYTKKLYSSLSSIDASPWGAVDLAVGNVEVLLSRHNASNDEITKFIHDRFGTESDLEIFESGQNLELRFSHPTTTIYIIRSWDHFNLPMSRHSASLILCVNDVSNAPDNIFTNANIRSISYLNHLNGFEQIYLFNPIYHCIRMIEATVRKLKTNHAELNHFINSMDSLLSELQNLSLTTHKAIEPEGNLVLTGVKNCIYRIKPMIDMISGLPDSKTIQIAESRLEWTAFSLTAFFSNVSNRLNTKKYINASLDQILRNDGLYRYKQKQRVMQNAFPEENLNTILASNLACFYHNCKDIDIQTEVPMGAGFADIVVKYEKNVSAIIEGKLVKQIKETSSKVAEGLSQLYNRYGNHNSILDTFGVELYLVLFAYDQNLNDLSEAALKEVSAFSERHSVELQTHMKGRDHLHFSFIDKRANTGLVPKKRSIFIFYCNMEVVKKDEHDYRIHKKSKWHLS